MSQKQRERIAQILSNSYTCNHCQKLFDETELFLMVVFRRPLPPSITRHKLDGLPKGYYLFCRGCIGKYEGSPYVNMIDMGMKRRGGEDRV